MRVVLVSVGTDEVWALVDLRPADDTVILRRFAVCEACGQLSAVPAGRQPEPRDRWATIADLPVIERSRPHA